MNKIQQEFDEAILSAYEDLRDDDDIYVRIAAHNMVKSPRTTTNQIGVRIHGWTDLTLPNAAQSHKMSVQLIQLF